MVALDELDDSCLEDPLAYPIDQAITYCLML